MNNRFTFNNKSLLKDNDFWLDGQVATLCNAKEICHELNKLNDENNVLKATNLEMEDYLARMEEEILQLKKENDWLKEEILKFKEWEKHIGDVKREDLDRVFKMSIYEIAEAFEYYRKRIKENHLNNCPIEKENEELKFENNLLQERNNRQAERLRFYRRRFGKME